MSHLTTVKMLRKDYNEFLSLKERVDKEITDLYSKLNIHDCCSPTSYDESTVEVEGDEYWAYGGHEKHYKSISVTEFLDDRKDIITDILKDITIIEEEVKSKLAGLTKEQRYQALVLLTKEFE